MHDSIEILKRDSLREGGFAGLKEHQLVKAPGVFGSNENQDGSWPGLGNFVYLADARFMPHGETRMHSHREIDVISIMVDGRIDHQGSLQHGNNLSANDVQVQRAGAEGFSHNEINPDNDWNRMLQLWVQPEVPGQAATYKVYTPVAGELSRIYGGANNEETDFPAKTKIDVAILSATQQVEVNETCLAYLARGNGLINEKPVAEGDLVRAGSIKFTAADDALFIIVHTE